MTSAPDSGARTPLVVLVTGGGSGLGAATAAHLAGLGHRVHVAGRRPEPLAELVDRGRRAGVELHAHPLDVTDPGGCGAVVDRVRERSGRLDVLVNNAGVFRRGLPSTVSVEDWEDTLATNLTGALHMAQAAVAAFRSQPAGADGVRGQVLNVNSGAGLVGYPPGAAYTASKFGLMGLSDALRSEVAVERIKVTDLVVATAVESELSGRTGVRRLPASAVAEVVADVIALRASAYLSRVDLAQLPEPS